MLAYVDEVIATFVSQVQECFNLDSKQAALAIFDNFKGQITEKLFEKLESYNIQSVLIPANCIDKLQSMDVSINRVAKSFLRSEFENWYATKICEQDSNEP